VDEITANPKLAIGANLNRKSGEAYGRDLRFHLLASDLDRLAFVNQLAEVLF
jgi:hypothetical protein